MAVSHNILVVDVDRSARVLRPVAPGDREHAGFGAGRWGAGAGGLIFLGGAGGARR